MEIVHAVLALTAACIGFALIARTARLPYAVILVLGGMALAFIPGVPVVELDPDLALAFFLPPLLMASAWRTDWRAFRAHLRPILLLAVGAVLFSAIMVALVAKLLRPGLPFAAALALGAIIAPPDAVAAGAVLARLKLPRRLSVVIEGESLVTDAAALVL
jgi:CPA1 family monovalent cation:H+ antiporter